MDHQLVVFGLAEELFGVEIEAVESIIKIQEITRLPQMPASICGVINLRGHILPVMDLRMRLGLPSTPHTPHSRIVIINHVQNKIGMMVDSVEEVVIVSDDAIESVSSIITTINSEFIEGIAKLDDRLIVLLNLETVLATAMESSEMI